MTESLVIAAILAICAVILWLRPQSISTLSGNPEENPELNWRAVRRIGAGGLLLLAVAAGTVANRFKRVSVPMLALVVLAYQLAGTLGEWAMLGNFTLAFQDFRIGIPGMVLQVLGGYLFIKYLVYK